MISNLPTTPWLEQRVFETKSVVIEAMLLCDKSAAHKTGKPWKSLPIVVSRLNETLRVSSVGR